LVRFNRSEQIEFNFRSRAPKGSPKGVLFEFLNSNQLISKKEAIIIAISSYWSPQAFQSEQTKDLKQLQKIALDSIYRIACHQKELEETYQLNSEELSPLSGSEVLQFKGYPSRSHIEFHFRCQPSIHSNTGILLNFINQEQLMTKKELFFKSVAAYWLTAAYVYCRDLDFEQLRFIAQSSVNSLRLHIQYLQQYYDLNWMPLAQIQAFSPIASETVSPGDTTSIGDLDNAIANWG